MTTDIRHLIDKYFEGETSAEEEKILRRYFAQKEIPEELKGYTSLFRFLDDEAAALAVLNEIQQKSSAPVRRNSLFFKRLRSIAAVAAIFIVAVLILTRPGSGSSNGDYVWIDGQQITDPSTVREYAESAFGKVKPETDIIEDQLRFMLE
ncbi:hypothetical protein [Proteiniphilum sp.]|uniref:hypothetical protein n=1 Tax=Proteiniphilum sp. TaxID=1926877 RepID=UPI002B1F279B|nr:hypothetical protein [Proteiniphilum sp.]MEA4918486.1 hypothetical protein [Proteiniphilum sp.]